MFQIQQIDHVELYVPDRYEAAAWYKTVFGLEIVPEFEFWAADPYGPLMLGTRKNETKLALFQGIPQGQYPVYGFIRVAFQVSGTEFLQFIDHARQLEIKDRKGQLFSRESIVDHTKSYSIYLNDPFGNYFEVTTYDYDTVHQELIC